MINSANYATTNSCLSVDCFQFKSHQAAEALAKEGSNQVTKTYEGFVIINPLRFLHKSNHQNRESYFQPRTSDYYFLVILPISYSYIKKFSLPDISSMESLCNSIKLKRHKSIVAFHLICVSASCLGGRCLIDFCYLCDSSRGRKIDLVVMARRDHKRIGIMKQCNTGTVGPLGKVLCIAIL